MKPASFAMAFCLVSSGFLCSAQAAPKYEAVPIPGTPKAAAALFRIEIATGKVVQVWGANTAYGTTADNSPLPPGEYHLYASTNPQADGTVSWSMERMDVVTGRTWTLTGGGNAPYLWVEVQAPK